MSRATDPSTSTIPADSPGETSPPTLIPGRYNPRFTRVFAWWVRKMMRKDFFAVRLARENAGLLASLEGHPGPVIVALNHASWWDPLVSLVLHARFTPGRLPTGPVEAEQFKRFGFMAKLGLFGIDPHDPRSAPLLVDHCLGLFREQPLTSLWVTPQAQFVDPRRKVQIRPGVSMVASACEGLNPRALSVAIEYVMWVDRKPELLLRFEEVVPPSGGASAKGTDLAEPRSEARGSTTAWHRAFTKAMRANQAALAELSMARDPAAFEVILGGDEGRINPLYDLWQRLRKRGGGIKAREFEG